MERDPKTGLDDTLAGAAPAPDATGATISEPISNAPTLAATSALPSWPKDTGIDPKPSSLSRYTLGTVLGRGGMGEVVSARDEQIGRQVAIKRMRATDPTSEQTARFLREAKIQGRLDHPAIVPVHELWHDARGQPYFVMKQLTGVTLADVLDKLVAHDPVATKKYSRQALLRQFADVCLAVEFAHAKGVVHRDLKPANVVLGDFGEVYVLDWGIARVIGDDTERASFSDVTTLDETGTVAGSLLGTPGYMSPEQVRGETHLDARSDVYSLGCILFELLALEPLHPRGVAALASTLEGPDATPSRRSVESGVAPELDTICVAATMIEPADRYASARALGEAVQHFLDGDRDVALRRDLASAELAAARRALEDRPDASGRRIAIRAAARALALDPTAREPAELVGKLMLEPPTEVPDEVEREIVALETDVIRSQARLAVAGVAAYLLFFPLFYFVGLRSVAYYVVGIGAVLLQLTSTLVLLRRPRYSLVRVAFATNLVAIVYFGYATSPFLIGTGLAVVSAMAFAMQPRFGGGWRIIVPCVLAVLAPIGVEQFGWIARRTDFSTDALIARLPVEHLNGTAMLTGLVLFVIFIVGVATMLSRNLAVATVNTQRALHLQAWQLRQLVPRAQTAQV